VNWVLVTMILLPAAAAAITALLRQGSDELARRIALGTSLAVLVLACVATASFDTHGPRFQLTMSWPWIPDFGVRFELGVDGIALVMLLLIAVLMPIVVGASWRDTAPERRSMRAYFAWLMLLEAFLVGVFSATDVFVFYVFFEAMLIPMYFLIGSFGGPRRQYAAMKFFVYSLVGGLVMLAAVIGLYVVSSQKLGVGTFAFDALNRLAIDPNAQKLLFLGFFLAFAIKAPLVPLHTWLPDAGAEAPIGSAVLLVGVLDKVGTFGFLRYCLPLFPDASRFFAPMVLVLAVIGVLYAALLAMGQSDMKRLVSYTSISHFGFIALGIFVFTPEAATGAVLYMVNLGISTALLFVVVGVLINRGGSRQIADYGGVARFAPLLAGSFFIAGLATLSLPGTNSFASEFLTLIGAFPVRPVYTIIATVGIILAALYVLLMYQRTMHGPARGVLLEGGASPAVVPRAAMDLPDDAMDDVGTTPHGGATATATLAAPVQAPARRLAIRDLDRREMAVIAPLVALIIVTGVYPQPLIDLIRPAVAATISDVGGNAHGVTPVHSASEGK
jgi:NADH-quinone oxidoreductase subunit M